MIVVLAGIEANGLLLWGEQYVAVAVHPAGRRGRRPRQPRPDPHRFTAATADLAAGLETVPAMQVDAMIERHQEAAESLVSAGGGWLAKLSTAELMGIMTLRPRVMAD